MVPDRPTGSASRISSTPAVTLAAAQSGIAGQQKGRWNQPGAEYDVGQTQQTSHFAQGHDREGDNESTDQMIAIGCGQRYRR
jgi:hypothetical protein